MYNISFSNQFKKDFKKCQKRGYKMSLLEQVLIILREKGKLPKEYKPHILTGNYSGFLECHIKPDWLLIWWQDDAEKEIRLDRTGTHADLF